LKNVDAVICVSHTGYVTELISSFLLFKPISDVKIQF
jgi:hypothetical protein